MSSDKPTATTRGQPGDDLRQTLPKGDERPDTDPSSSFTVIYVWSPRRVQDLETFGETAQTDDQSIQRSALNQLIQTPKIGNHTLLYPAVLTITRGKKSEG